MPGRSQWTCWVCGFESRRRAWLFCCECCMLSGRGICDELITRTEESYRLWCIIECDLETSRMRRHWPALGPAPRGNKCVRWWFGWTETHSALVCLCLTGYMPLHCSNLLLINDSLFDTVHSELLSLLLKKDKSVPLQAWSGPEGSRKLRFPDYVTTAQNGGKVVSLSHRPPLPSGNAPGTHFC